jgi:hypothetical protein
VITFISVEGVLAKSDDLKSSPPTKWARSLYHGLASDNSIIFLTKTDPDTCVWWLKREHIRDYSRVLSWNNALSWKAWKIDKVRETLAEGWEVFAFVDIDPQIVEEIAAMGVAGICVSYPHIAPGWKEVAAPRQWQEVVTTMENTP